MLPIKQAPKPDIDTDGELAEAISWLNQLSPCPGTHYLFLSSGETTGATLMEVHTDGLHTMEIGEGSSDYRDLPIEKVLKDPGAPGRMLAFDPYLDVAPEGSKDREPCGLVASKIVGEGGRIAIWFFRFGSPRGLSKEEWEQMSALAGWMSFIVAAIFAKSSLAQTTSDLLAKEWEKTVLISLGERVLAVRDRGALLDLLVDDIKAIFGYSGCYLLVTEEARNKLQLWFEKADERAAVPAMIQAIREGQALDGTLAKSILRDRQPFIHPSLVAGATANKDALSYLPVDGAGEVLVGILRNSAGIFGCLVLTAEKQGQLRGRHPSFQESVFELLASAVANILAMEELLEKEREKSMLLSISRKLAGVRDFDDLGLDFAEFLKTVVPFDEMECLLYDGQLVTQRIAFASKGLRARRSIDHANDDFIGTAVAGTPSERIIGFASPTSRNIQEWRMEYPGQPDLAALEALQLVKGLYLPLRLGERLIGTLILLSRKEDGFRQEDLALYNNLGSQLAVAVANVLGTLEVERRQLEKERLLAISRQLAMISDRNEFGKILAGGMRTLLDFDEAVVMVLDRNSAYAPFVLIDPEDDQHPFLPGQLPAPFPLEGSPLERLVGLGELVSFDNRTLRGQFPEYGKQMFLYDEEHRHSVGIALRSAGRLFGYFHLHFNSIAGIGEEKMTLLSAVGEQVAVVVSNILAKEEILQRERIKELQVSIGQVLTREQSWKERFQHIGRILKDEIPFRLFLGVIRWDDANCETYGMYRTGKNEYESIGLKQLIEATGESQESFLINWRELGRSYQAGEVFQGEVLQAHLKKHPIKRALMEHFRLQSNLHYAFFLDAGKRIGLAFFHPDEDVYRTNHLAILDSVQGFTALCLERAMAFDQVKELSIKLRRENIYLQEEIRSELNFDMIIGQSPLLKEVFRSLELVASTDTTVLITGETGTGKELIARSLHNASARKGKPLIKVNCAALPANLIESELFGHEKGAFTSAVERRIGKFELADGGSIFLDEIGELPVDLQAKLLRVLQEKEFERIGGKTTIKCDVRIIAATNRQLEEEMEKGRFRADLFYRLSVFPIQMPALRSRREDIPLLATHFAQKYSTRMNKPFKGIEQRSYDELLAYDWPGNVRELENVMEQAVIVSKGGYLSLGRQLINPRQKLVTMEERNGDVAPVGSMSVRDAKLLREQKEKDAIISALKVCKGRVRGPKGAATMLAVKPSTLDAKMLKYGIIKGEYAGLGPNK